MTELALHFCDNFFSVMRRNQNFEIFESLDEKVTYV